MSDVQVGPSISRLPNILTHIAFGKNRSLTHQSFQSLLTVTIQAPRLSGSKVKQLADSVLTLLDDDTQVVSALLRSHKNAKPGSLAKISSLYVFDAISKAVKASKDKRAAGMALKLEGMCTSVIAEMLVNDKGGVWTEGKVRSAPILSVESGGDPNWQLDRKKPGRSWTSGQSTTSFHLNV